MNDQLQEFARAELKEGLSKCSESQQNLFKRMYAEPGSRMSEAAKIALHVNAVVDNMDEAKLDWAMQQVNRTLDNAKG